MIKQHQVGFQSAPEGIGTLHEAVHGLMEIPKREKTWVRVHSYQGQSMVCGSATQAGDLDGGGGNRGPSATPDVGK